MKNKLISFLVVVFSLLTFAHVASAQCGGYVPNCYQQTCTQTSVTVSVSPDPVYQGDSITITGSVSPQYTCQPVDPTVYLYLDGDYIGSTNTDCNGQYSFTYTLPSSICINSHTITAKSTYSGCPEGSGSDTFTVKASCSQGYLSNWQCNGNWRQREYQYSDCTRVWQNYDYCSDGCFSDECGPSHRCTPQYFDSYRCDGGWKQQMYQNADCSLDWVNVQYCSDGCFSDGCHAVEPCDISVSVSTPKDLYVGNTIETTIDVSNSGDRGGWVDFTAYVCRSDGTNCKIMSCDEYGDGDPLVYVDGHESESFSCSRKAGEESWHKIKVVYSGCERYTDPTIYSGRFEVLDKPKCAQGYQDDYRCSDNWKQHLYQFSDCSTEWKDVEYCSDGCSDGKCTVKPKESIPKVILKDEYEVRTCETNEIYFDVMNVGDKSDTFSISYSGTAADWISSVASISLDAGEKKTVTAYVDVPCFASDLQHFTVKASNTQTASATSFFKILGAYTGWFAWNGGMSDIVIWGLIFLLVVGVLLTLVLFFVWALSGKRNGRDRPESFNHFQAAVSKKIPECFK